MSGGFSLFPEMAHGHGAGISQTTGGVTVQGNTSVAFTEGSWTQIIASTLYDATWIEISLANDSGISGNVNNLLVSIGIGAAGSEVTLIPHLHSNSWAQPFSDKYLFPVSIPAGTRIAARVLTEATSANSCYVECVLFDGGFMPIEITAADDIGVSTATANFTQVALGISGAKGSFIQLIANTIRDYAGLVVGVNDRTNAATGYQCIDVAIGAAGSEEIIIPNYLSFVRSLVPTTALFFPEFTQIPAGTRISVRASTNVATPGVGFWVGAYGIYQ